MSIDDSMKVTEDSDGTFTFEWDKNDPRYSQFNDMTSEQFSEFVNNALKKAIDDYYSKAAFIPEDDLI